ncbi:hypothetical protein C1645_837041 [Glomus cerebriforme]|uniref:Uncharacterized protein n=1 Tax=Glomus cerebriforme TaxID=658196 RepID=A0A397SAV4_9GLOM|nr:hypothetical protein C1645_837041 [Glomus cerebriforme]
MCDAQVWELKKPKLPPDPANYSKAEQKISKEISSKSVNSKIITSKHSELISKWIDKPEESEESSGSCYSSTCSQISIEDYYVE